MGHQPRRRLAQEYARAGADAATIGWLSSLASGATSAAMRRAQLVSPSRTARAISNIAASTSALTKNLPPTSATFISAICASAASRRARLLSYFGM